MKKISGLFRKLNLDNDYFKIESIDPFLPLALQNQKHGALGNSGVVDIILHGHKTIKGMGCKYFSNGQKGFRLLDPSHKLLLKKHKSSKNIIKSPFFYLTQVLSLLTRYSVMPNVFWRFTNILPFKHTGYIHEINSLDIEKLMIDSLIFWDSLDSKEKIIITNVLWRFNESRHNKKNHELLEFLYPINDCLFSFFHKKNPLFFKLSEKDMNKPYYQINHGKRLSYILKSLKINLKKIRPKTITKTRNNLIHDLNWGETVFNYGSNKKVKDLDVQSRTFEKLIELMIIKTVCPSKRENKHLIHHGSISMILL